MSGTKLAYCSVWWNGPEFLRETEQQWPRAEAFPPNEITEAEVIKHPISTTHVLLSFNELKVCMHTITDCTRFSSLSKLLRVNGICTKVCELIEPTG